jgi:predicted Fe-S protein YdhL (DUF1289 family)
MAARLGAGGADGYLDGRVATGGSSRAVSDVSTPCVRLCVVDPVTGLCRGCRRTIGEIAAWAGLSEADRRAIMARLAERPTPQDSGAA